MNDTTKNTELVETESKELTKPQTLTPMMILDRAIEKGTDVDQLEKLMALQERYEANEAKKLYVAAMAQFRAKCPTISKTREAHNSMYAGLAETINQIKGEMSNAGLSHSWKTNQEGQLITVTCCITHIGGHSACTSLSGEPDTSGSKNKIQAVGSTVAYLERYTLFAALGLASGDMDNDGNMPVEYITEEQVADLTSLMDEVGADKAAFLKYANVTAICYIHAEDYLKAQTALEAKRK